MEVLAAIQILNAALDLGVNGLSVAQKIGPLIEQSIKSGQPIPAADWKTVMDEADQADAKLAADIRAQS